MVNWRLIYLQIWGFFHEFVFAWWILVFGTLAGYPFTFIAIVGLSVNYCLNWLAEKCMNEEGSANG